MAKYRNKLNKGKINIIQIGVLIFICIILFLINDYNEKNKYGYGEKNYDQLWNALQWLKTNTDLNSIIITEWYIGPVIVGQANRRVIASTKVYPSEISLIAERFVDISKFFYSLNEDEAMAISKKYNISYVFVSKNFQIGANCRYINFCNFTDERGLLLPQYESKILVYNMLNKKKLSRFSMVYENNRFIIYQLRDPVN